MRSLSLTFHLFQRFAHRNLAQENTACADPGALKSPLPRPFDRSGVLRIERNLKASKAQMFFNFISCQFYLPSYSSLPRVLRGCNTTKWRSRTVERVRRGKTPGGLHCARNLDRGLLLSLAASRAVR